MLVLENGELLHTDSSQDIIEHYGVKGMRWGQHRRNMKSIKKKYSSQISDKKQELKAYKKLYKKENRHNDKELANITAWGRKATGQQLEKHAQKRVELVKKMRKAESDYKSIKLDRRSALRKQKLIDKYSKTEDEQGFNKKGQRKFDKSLEKRSKQDKKLNKKLDKRTGRRLDAPYFTTGYSDGVNTYVIEKRNPIAKYLYDKQK